MADYTNVSGNQCLNLTFPSVPCPFSPNLTLFLGRAYSRRKSICLYVVSPWQTYPSSSIHKLLAWSWNPIVKLSHQKSPDLCVLQREHERTCLRHLTHFMVSSLLSAKGSHGCGNIIWGSFFIVDEWNSTFLVERETENSVIRVIKIHIRICFSIYLHCFKHVSYTSALCIKQVNITI